jgi:hypothetical protein
MLIFVYILIALGFFMHETDKKAFSEDWFIYLIYALIWPIFLGADIAQRCE